jgi:hypothetical protein
VKTEGLRSLHDTLVTGTVALQVSVVKTLSDVRGLLLNRDEHVTGLVIESLVGRVVANLLDGVSDNSLEVDVGTGGDFTEDLRISMVQAETADDVP